MLKMLIVLLVVIAYYATFKLCKSAATDNQELEDKLFLERYVYGKSIEEPIIDSVQGKKNDIE